MTSATSPFADMPIAEFLDTILAGGDRADEAMYFLLHQRRVGLLRNKHMPFRRQLLDGFDDVLEDFFLYLREEKEGVPYPSLHTIKKREAFESWIINTFRNYLSLRAAKEGRLAYAALSTEPSSDGISEGSAITDERKLAVASHLIAYAHQAFSPRDAFILLRTLLTLLNRKQAMPTVEMAQALGMSPIAYRVTVHRMKRNLADIRSRLLRGENLPLDSNHRLMAGHINDDFAHLYPTLYAYYTRSIDMLPTSATINQLRQHYLDTTGQSLHEVEMPYSLAPSIGAFWTMLSHLVDTHPAPSDIE